MLPRMGAAMQVGDPFPAMPHDHRRCVDEALDAAVRICEGRGIRLTELRRQVLELVWRSHAPVGAYRLMELLGRQRGAVAPPTVYRALDFLVQHGLVHRIESLNAFVGCHSPAASHRASFLICRACGQAVEFDDPDLAGTLDRRLAAADFSLDEARIEIVGTCSQCRRMAA
jgi:Fur family zinc uptake transcriptional regulator